MSNNSIWLKGNLGYDPEIKTTKSGKNFVSIRIAVSDTYYDSEKRVWQDMPLEWFTCCGFKDRHLLEAKNLKKGALVCIQGRIKNSEYYDKEGNRRHSVDIVITSLSEIVRRKYPRPEEQGLGV